MRNFWKPLKISESLWKSLSLNASWEVFRDFYGFSDFFRNLTYFWEKRQKRGRERGEGGGKISHFGLNTPSEVFGDFRGFSVIFRGFQRFSEIFRDFQRSSGIFRNLMYFGGKEPKKGWRGRGRRRQNIKFQVLKISGNPWTSLTIPENHDSFRCHFQWFAKTSRDFCNLRWRCCLQSQISNFIF